MEFKKSIIIIILAIFIVSIASVSAEDVNDTAIASGDTQLTDEIIQSSEIQGSYNDEVALSEEDSGKIAISNDNKTLGKTVTGYSFFDIESAIESDCTIYLKPGIYTGNYYIYISQKSNIKIIGNSTILDAQNKTQIFCIQQSNNITIQNITFKNGYERYEGGAIYVYSNSNYCSISNCTFINNHAKRGGAIYWTAWSHNGQVSNCTFINNSASEEGGAINWFNSNDCCVIDCTFINNHANESGGAIDWSADYGRVNDCIFINNTARRGHAIDATSGLNVDYNWFGNNASNYNESLPITGVNCNYRLFLNATANPDTITGSDTSNITFKLYQYHSGNISDYDNAPFKNLNLTITATNGNAASTAKLGEPIQFTPAGNGIATVTAAVENVVQTVEIKVNEKGEFDLLQNLVNNESLSVINLERNYTFNESDTITDGVRITRTITINGNGYTIDAQGKARVFDVQAGNVTIENLTIKNANSTGGGAVYFAQSGSVINCNFTGNTADVDGGALYFQNTGTVSNCNFTANQATTGGAIRFNGEGNVTNCNFTANTATYDSGAVYFQNTGSVSNCNFINNTATNGAGGAIHMNSGSVTNCNFTDNEAYHGGAIRFNGEGNVTNCNFTGNTATGTNSRGGAVYFNSGGDVRNCNFTDNTATYYGGAVCFNINGEVTNCNFVDNKAAGDYSYGGAIRMYSGTVSNCNFTDNTATYYGGAVYFNSKGEVTNCNFVDNKAAGDYSYGGAVYFFNTGNVSNCNFTGNNATAGSAIYFYRTSATKTVSNSRFLNNRANAETLEVIKNDNNITITFTGQNNLLNAIYSMDNAEVTFNNVTYWGKNGITTISTTKSGFNKEEGQNITVGVVVNDKLVLSEVMVTDENGQIVLDIITGNNYYIGVRHDTDSYYTEAERTISNNTKFNVNVTSQTTHNRTVNITAKSNIYSEVLPGKLLFILPNGDEINATYAGNGTWWAVHRFADYGVYQVNASCDGLNNVTVNKGTLTVIPPEHTFSFLNYIINSNNNPVINLSDDFYFDPAYDTPFVGGIVINRPVTIKGNGSVIDAKGQARIFNVQSADTVIENLTLKNAHANDYGGAIYFFGQGTVTNCNFTGNTATGTNSRGGAVYFNIDGDVRNCNFTANTATYGGGAVYFLDQGTVTNCNFTDNKGTGYYSYGGAICMSSGSVTNCNFTNNTATYEGGAVLFYHVEGNVINCSFNNNSAYKGGAILFDSGSSGRMVNCNFTDNTAENSGGAVYFRVDNCEVTKCNFADNTAGITGGAIYMISGSIKKCNFTNNSGGIYGGAIEMMSGSVENCNFTNNSAKYGGAIRMEWGSIENCNFTDNNATTGSAIYFYSVSDTKTVSNSIFLNNRANAETLEVTKNENNITITFTGNNNLLNAIQSRDDSEVTFTNVTYWSANGISNTGNSATKPLRSNKEAGQNITVGVVVNGEIVLEGVKVTDENGMIVLDIIAGENYYITARHDTDSYYTEAEKTISTMKFNVNVTSQTTNNKTVNITAKSNIPNEIIDGKLLFILPNSEEISANYGGNGTWWAAHKFDDYGVYEVNASYTGLDNVTVNNGTITINKPDSTIMLDDITLNYGESKNVTVTTTGATEITASINGTDVTVINNYTIPISGLAAGNYTLNVTTVPDGDHNSVSKEVKIIVYKATAEITVDSATMDIKVLDEVLSGATLTPADAGNLTYKSNNETVVIVKDGKIKALAKGTATITVSFAGNENYTAAENKTINVTVNLKDAIISVNNSTLNLFVDDNFTVVATTSPDGLNVTFVQDDSGVYIVDENGNVTALREGTGNILVKVGGDGVYAENSTTVTVIVSKVPTEITVDTTPLDLFVGDEIVIVANLTPADAGNVTFTSSDYDVVDFDYEGNFIAQGKGQAIITVSFAGDDKYAAAQNKTIIINVSLGNASVTVDNDTLDLKVGETSAINATKHPDTIMLDITYTSSNSSVATVDKKGIVAAVGEGTAIITVEVGDDEIYAKNSTTVTVTVSKIPTEITLTNTTLDLKVGDEVKINVTLTPSEAGELDYISSDVSVVTVNGIGELTAVGEGTANITVRFLGDDKYVASNVTVAVTVSKVPTEIILVNSTVDMKVGDEVKVNATLTPSEAGVLDFTSSDVSVVTVNGIGELTAVGEGTANITVRFLGDDKYKAASKNTTVNVAKDSTKLTAENVTATYKVDKYLVITLTDSNGNPLTNATVTVELSAAKNYTTDENGQVKVKVSNMLPKTYTAKISFAGNGNYLGCDDDVKVVVKKATPKITAKAKTFKTTTKTKKYTITLKDNDGKAIKKGTVYLKVGGKTYKATTNSKGKATFKITKFNNKGTYKATVTYKGNKYYNKATKKVTIKVKSVWKTVSKGSKNSAIVKKIQRALKNHGYYLEYNGRYLMVDGIYWDYTEMAVKEFQNDKVLKVTGKVDEKTAKKLGIIK